MIPAEERGYERRATEKGYDQSVARIQKTAYSHEAMIDMIIANPRITQNQLATEFGYSVPWVSRVMGSDAFQAALARRRDEITDPFLIATMEEKFRGLVDQSLNVLAEKLAATQSADLALKTLDVGVKALGFGAREKNVTNNNSFVVALPGKSASAEDWIATRVARTPVPPPAQVIENQPLSTTVTRDPTIQPDEMRIAP